jgi:hypothetical protein
MRMRWPLIGRSEEMRAIQAAISASDVSGIVVYGAAGVGKSRIAREALSAAESHGCEGRLAVDTHHGWATYAWIQHPPYNGRTVTGREVIHVVDGRIVFLFMVIHDLELPEPPTGVSSQA